MSRSWLTPAPAALLSLVMSVPAAADCVCARDRYSNEQVCGRMRDDGSYYYVNPDRYPSTLNPVTLRKSSYYLCSTPPPPTPTFGIVGSNTIGEELIPPLIDDFSRRHNLQTSGHCPGTLTLKPGPGGAPVPETVIRCDALGTHFGIPALTHGLAEIAMLSRPITEAEAADAMTGSPGLTPEGHVLALDGVAVVVSPDNRLSALTLDQVADVFSGKITDWSQLGGDPAPIRVFIRNINSGTRDTFTDAVMTPRHLDVEAQQTEYFSSSELSKAVAANPNGIGFVGYAYTRNADAANTEFAKALTIEQSCGISYDPTEMTIKTEAYPLARRLFLYTGKSLSPAARLLLDDALGDSAQAVIKAAHSVDRSILRERENEAGSSLDRIGDYPTRFRRLKQTERDLEFDEKTFAKLSQSTRSAERLSVNFYFKSGKDQFGSQDDTLDVRARQDIRLLAHYLNHDARGRDVLLAGFADAKGRFLNNLGISRRRADAVRTALIAAGVAGERLAADGFGELLPVVCNSPDTPQRRSDARFDDEVRLKNRRVEVWLLPGR